MLINRHNYEEFFLLYVDNELSVAERKAVEAFVEENADLEEELVMMMQSVLRPDKNVVFGNKESLLKNKPINGLVNGSNYEEYFLLYGDNELNNEEKDLVEQFVYKHPQYQAEFELIQQARFIPEHATIYPDKNELYRTERDERVIPFAWWKIAAAAIVILFLGVTAWYMTSSNNTGDGKMGDVVKNIDTATKKTIVQPKANNQSQLAVTEEKKVIEEKAPVVDLKNDLATNNTKKEKNIKKESNIEAIKNVPQESVENNFVAVENTKPSRATSTAISVGLEKSEEKVGIPASVVAFKDPSASMKQTSKEVIYIDEYTSDDDIKFANASISKKPMRGLIRKVKGLFEGNVSNDADDNDPAPTNKKGIRIAAFEIGLK